MEIAVMADGGTPGRGFQYAPAVSQKGLFTQSPFL